MTDLLWLLERINWLTILDILLVSLIFFLVLMLVKATQAVPLVRGMFVLVVAALFLTSIARLPTFSVIASAVLPALLVAIPVIFQPELRRALGQLGRMSDVLTLERHTDMEVTTRVVSESALSLAARNWGALIILERETGLQDLVDTGVKMNANLTA
ncbi:MAG TPA: diadenylate cyclase, partial [Thermoflexales bacterium]|nr:diadenylate cyclase [Thermoflexales bacterium]